MMEKRLKYLQLVLIVYLDFSIATGTQTCPSGWADFGNGCYIVKTQPNPFANAYDADQLCSAIGANLATIPDSATDVLVRALVLNATMQGSSPTSYAYIGLSDILNAGSFDWMDNTTSTYTNMSATTPNYHFIPNDRRCVAMYSSDRQWQSSGIGMSWEVVPCCFQIFSINMAVCSKNYSTTTAQSGKLKSYCFGLCPSGYHKLNSTCYSVAAVSGLSQSNVSDVRRTCLDSGADLISFPSQDVNAFLTYVINETAKQQSAANVSFFIGVTDLPSAAGTYTNMNGTSLGFIGWDVGQPVQANGDCAMLSWNKTADSVTVWKTVSCCANGTVKYRACQKPELTNVTAVPLDDDPVAKQCYQNFNECSSSPCQNGATCTDHVHYYTCTCLPDYTGTYCLTKIDPCTSGPCGNGGTCHLVNSSPVSYACSCPSGISGANCETIWNQCISSPCQYNGTCTPNPLSYTPNVNISHTCACQVGTTGAQCETNFNDCVNSTYAATICKNGATCVDGINGYTCSCVTGFAGSDCGAQVHCAPITVANITNTTCTGNGVSLGDTCTYSCKPGYQFPDMTIIKTITCLNTNQWSANPAGCQPSCPFLPKVGNATARNPSTAVGTTVVYDCLNGFILPGNATKINSTCMADGNWSVPLQDVSCQIRHCPTLPKYPYQSMDTSMTTYNTTVTFWCDVGYQLFDNTTARTIKCLADGTWTADLPPCNPVYCPVLPLQDHTKRNTSENSYLTYAQYTCDSNYRMLDGSTYRIILCDAGAEWSDDITDCRTDRCFPLPYVANATPSTTNATYWTQSILTCIKGHKFLVDGGEKDSQIMTCQENGWWNPILTSCQPIYCPEVTSGKNIVPDTTSRLYSTVRTYTCTEGYYIDPTIYKNSISIECMDNEKWNFTDSVVIPDCWPIQCPEPPDQPQNGTRDLFDGRQNDVNNYKNYSRMVDYSCNPGTKFIDGRVSKKAQCNKWGSWNESDVSCRSDRCNPVNITAHATPNTRNTSWYTNVTYHCNTGYTWLNNQTSYNLMCMAGGSWNDSFDFTKDCIIKNCSAVEQMPNATANATDHFYGALIEYTCQTGFLYEKDNTTTRSRLCDDIDGSFKATWIPTSGNMEECKIIHCPKLPDVENATMDSNDTFYDVTVHYNCWPGYQFSDKARIKPVTCRANATWTDIPGPCEVIFCPPVPYWASTIFNTTDNNFMSTVSYYCSDGYAFKEHKEHPGNETSLISMCNAKKVWQPPIKTCESLQAINADIAGKSYESPQGVPIGSVACAMMCLLMAAIVLIDLQKILTDMRMMRSNISSLIQHQKHNKVGTD